MSSSSAAAAAPPAGTMKCVHASELGTDVDKILTVVSDAEKPEVDVSGGKMMLVRVEACSISAGDAIMLSGAVDKMIPPPGFPFIPGMDVCGVVEEVAADCDRFKVGDRIIATNGMMPVGGLAEYCPVHTKWAAKAPENVDAVQAAVLPNSPCAAMHAVKAAKIKPGERVLVLGGSGGVGTSLLQLVKNAEASYLATTSTDEALCSSLGADRVIDYRQTNWFEDASFKETPFDVVIDCIGWRDEWKESFKHGVLKPGHKGGRYVVVAFTDNPVMHSIWQGVQMFVPVLWRLAWTSVNRFLPTYKLFVSEPTGEDLDQLSDLVREKRLKPVLESRSPFSFSVEGVRDAYRLQMSKHAHGKVVVKISPSS